MADTMKTETIVVMLVVGIVASLGVNLLLFNPESIDQEEYNMYKVMIDQLKVKTNMQMDEINQLEQLYSDLSSNISTCIEAYNDLLQVNESYHDLLQYMNLTLVDDFTQTVEYNISAGTEETWEFYIPEYQIIWEAKISFSGMYVSMSHAWRHGNERYFVGSSGISLTYNGSANITYYGPQEYLWGNITVDYYLSDREDNKIWVMGNIQTNLPTISRGGDAYIDV